MNRYNLAQLNIARLQAPLDSPQLADFVANLDRINLLAEQSAGFVWRCVIDDEDAAVIRPFGDDYIVNLSLWNDMKSLHDFVYRTAHTEIMRRRKEWFHKMEDSYSVMWWVPVGDRPTESEAKEKLFELRDVGATANAFTFKQFFPSPE
ncbi:MAG: DUF3291 domain-containing protein [Woeseia sp.]|nr:DUF3291 domain-containing protein [Woeseia sp.]MBT8098045.1 DUF3291 domain-containing protein [Woeseia sp.]NNE60074.1 DUF3291 domain-containing protein [Woeseia sp.]NNL54761.1 DUF3291 domain-containing protein [Woeseia sp.]